MVLNPGENQSQEINLIQMQSNTIEIIRILIKCYRNTHQTNKKKLWKIGLIDLIDCHSIDLISQKSIKQLDSIEIDLVVNQTSIVFN